MKFLFFYKPFSKNEIDSIFKINKRDSVALICITEIPKQVFNRHELICLSVWGQLSEDEVQKLKIALLDCKLGL